MQFECNRHMRKILSVMTVLSKALVCNSDLVMTFHSKKNILWSCVSHRLLCVGVYSYLPCLIGSVSVIFKCLWDSLPSPTPGGKKSGEQGQCFILSQGPASTPRVKCPGVHAHRLASGSHQAWLISGHLFTEFTLKQQDLSWTLSVSFVVCLVLLCI